MGNELYNVPLEDWLDQRFKEILPAKTVTYSRRPEKHRAVRRWMAKNGYAIVRTKTHVLITRRGQVMASRPLECEGTGSGVVLGPSGRPANGGAR